MFNIITPVEKIGDLWVKRDDLFKPFEDSSVNGGKLRQCLALIEKNKDKIRNGIITTSSVLSPQQAIIPQVARHYNVPCEVFYGGTSYEKFDANVYSNVARQLGAKTVICSKSGRQSVLDSHAKKEALKTGMYLVKYGMDLLENKDCFIDSTSTQVQNIPDNLDNLVITCGSATTVIGVIIGIKMFDKKVKNIICVGVAPNRMDKITSYICEISKQTGEDISLDNVRYIDAFGTMKGFKYENKKIENIGDLILHPRYEAKTYNWLKTNIDCKNEKTLLWVVGGEIC